MARARRSGRRSRPVGPALLATTLLAGCLSWPDHQVAPVVKGVVRGADGAQTADEIRLVIRHRENHTLFVDRRVGLDANGAFRFDAIRLPAVGREYSKTYRAYLHLLSGGSDRVVWRTAFSRRELAGAIALDCVPDRPLAHGQPCRVEDPTAHPWLVARGRDTFASLCAGCHGPDARGRGPAPDLTRIDARRGSPFDHDAVAAWIEGRATPAAHGERIMPVWGERLSQAYARYAEGDDLIGARLDPVVAYLESIQRNE